MTDNSDPQHLDSSRLKQVNLELGRLAKEHKACRVNSFSFSALGAVVLAISLMGLVQILPTGGQDWTQNPDSPVYALAAEQENASMSEIVLVAAGFVIGLGLLFRARLQCSKQRLLWRREGNLQHEMRQLRDKLYIVDQPRPGHEPHPDHHVGHTEPLDAVEARGEYVGVYNPQREQDHSATHRK